MNVPVPALEVTVPDTGIAVPLATPCTLSTPPEGDPADPGPTTVAFRLAAVACVTVFVQLPLWVVATVPVTVVVGAVSTCTCRFDPVACTTVAGELGEMATTSAGCEATAAVDGAVAATTFVPSVSFASGMVSVAWVAVIVQVVDPLV